MTHICFTDTETTSLRRDRRAWEVGIILRDEEYGEREHQWFVDVRDLDLGNADPMALKIGRFYERHPQMAAGSINGGGNLVLREDEAMRRAEKLTRGAHIVGAVPSFDTEVLAARMRANGVCPSWHYHLCDVENLAAGWLSAYAAYLERGSLGGDTGDRAAALRAIAVPPWNSDELARAVGVEPDEERRHTALGDAAMCRDIWDAVMEGVPS